MSPDPLERYCHVNKPQAWNRYAYVLNDAGNEIDPRGLECYSCLLQECNAPRQQIEALQYYLIVVETERAAAVVCCFAAPVPVVKGACCAFAVAATADIAVIKLYIWYLQSRMRQMGCPGA